MTAATRISAGGTLPIAVPPGATIDSRVCSSSLISPNSRAASTSSMNALATSLFLSLPSISVRV